MVLNLRQLKNLDWSLPLVATLLVLVGLSVIYSVTLSQTEPDYTLLNKQIVFFVVGFILFLVFMFLDYRTIGSVSWFVYVLSVLTLALVLFWGPSIHGTRSWFRFLGFTFQPVEFAKVGFVLFLAKFLSGRIASSLCLKDFVVSFAIVSVPVILVLIQPDFGSALIFIITWFFMIWFSGLKNRHVYFMLLIILIVSTLSWFFILAPYQKDRILNFIDPGRDLLGAGYNVHQSIIAVGSGGLVGRGLGLGTQSQLHFLPEIEADFIFASLAEELGFFGCMFLLILFGLFFLRFYRAFSVSRDNFSQLVVLGFLSIFFLQVAVNIGMSLGLLPVTGLPLPFISSGGSFLIMSFVMLGIVESIILRNKGVV
ncbi:MAG: rod shape-determining protein RodA [Patescibacteria group bacterium]